MKKFIKYVIKNYFAIPLIGLIILIFTFFSKTKLSESDLSHAYATEINSYGWVTNVDKIAGFILGSSTLRYGISANRLSKNDSVWINFSMDARDPVVLYYLLKKYYTLKKPKIILVGLDPWIYAKKYYLYRNKIMYLDLNEYQMLNYLSTDYFVFIQKARFLLQDFFSPNKKKDEKMYNYNIPDDYGSSYINKTPLNFDDSFSDKFEIKSTGWSDLQFDYLEKINLFCVKNKIRVIYIIPPKKNKYIKVANTLFLVQHNIWWQKICNRLENAEVLGNYSTFKNINQDSIFADIYHLNKNGQVLFTKFLKDNLNKTSEISPEYSVFGND
ncbi:MAG: hypothetical protein Q8K64_13755 [Sediminibacterium sp.]|nr:hypothetical protein [Sediminibacterium sp.]